MLKLFLTLILAGMLPALSPWKTGDLDIHMIAAGKGENTFVIMPDGTTMLIDAGASDAEGLIGYIKKFSPNPEGIDYLLLTHYHGGHTGSAAAVGENFILGRIVDRSYPDYAKTDAYASWVKTQEQKAAKFIVGSRSQFSPVKAKLKDFNIWNVAGGGLISTGNGLLSRPMSSEDPAKFDENMMSCAILLRYGPFSYYTGGDLPGSNCCMKEFRDFESQVAEMTGPVTAMKLHHHGGPDGTSAGFLWKMRPEVMLVSGGNHEQPCPMTLRRISDPQMPCAHQVYATSNCAIKGNGKDLWKTAVAGVGHIVLRVSDGGRSYQVFVLDDRYRVLSASELRKVERSQVPGPDSHIAFSDDFGRIDQAADSLFREVSNVSGTDEIHSMIILKDGKKIYERYDTGHTADERHVMWSASKTFTSVAVGFAVQDSLFSIDDKVISFFRDDELPAQRSEWLCKMTVKDLLTMSSGLGTDGITKVRSLIWKHPAKEVFAVPMAFEPGSKYNYNSMNTYLLSEIVQRRSGMKLSEYLTVKLFRPLGICNWEWEESADGVTCGGWGLYTTTENFAKLGQFLLQKGSWEGKKLLNSEWIEDLSSPQVYQSGKPEDEDWKAGYGYQVWRCTHNAFRADGARGQFCIVIPEKNAVVTVNGQFVKGKREFMKNLWKMVWPQL